MMKDRSLILVSMLLILGSLMLLARGVRAYSDDEEIRAVVIAAALELCGHEPYRWTMQNMFDLDTEWVDSQVYNPSVQAIWAEPGACSGMAGVIKTLEEIKQHEMEAVK